MELGWAIQLPMGLQLVVESQTLQAEALALRLYRSLGVAPVRAEKLKAEAIIVLGTMPAEGSCTCHSHAFYISLSLPRIHNRYLLNCRFPTHRL